MVNEASYMKKRKVLKKLAFFCLKQDEKNKKMERNTLNQQDEKNKKVERNTLNQQKLSFKIFVCFHLNNCFRSKYKLEIS